MRARKQDAVIFVQETEPGKLNCLAHARGDKKLVFDNWVDGVEIASNESLNRISKAMGAGKAVSVSQRMAVDGKLFWQ